MKRSLSFVFLFLVLGFKPQEKPTEKYNFLFIMVDDLVPVLGSYGHPTVLSPNIDKLASQSVQFNRAYCNVPVCGASRASLLTGIRPHYPDRFILHTSRADKDFPAAITLPKLLKDNGYYTISNGKVFHNPEDSKDSWSEKPWKPSEGGKAAGDSDSEDKTNETTGRGPFFQMADVPDTAFADGKLATKSIRDLRKLSKMGQPFFLTVGFMKPHLPFIAPKKYFDLYKNVPLADNRFLPENMPNVSNISKEIRTYGYTEHYNTDKFHEEARHAYYACVSYVDAQIGKVLGELKTLGLEKNTIVVLIGDHGWHLGEHNIWGKHNTLLNALHAPMIIKVPGQKPAKLNQIVEFVDLYPTFCELAQIKYPNHPFGASLLHLMQKKKVDWKNTAYSEWLGARSVVTDRYAYTYWFEDKHKGASMLYDHQKDPQENKNVVDEPAYAKVASEHKQMVLKLYQNPLLRDKSN